VTRVDCGLTKKLPSRYLWISSMKKQPRGIKFSPGALRRVKQAAKKTGMTVSAFVEQAAEKEANQVLDRKICTECGRMV
jgi:uncharacterized protein (DUF1778 family)